MILTTLIEVAAGMKNKNSFHWANIYEANFNFDALVNRIDFPAILCIPPNITDHRTDSAVLNTLVDLELFFLGRLDNATVEHVSAQVESQLMTQMLTLGREFIWNLNTHQIINPTTDGITDVKWEPVYNWGDVNCYGYTIKIAVPIMEGITGCQH